MSRSPCSTIHAGGLGNAFGIAVLALLVALAVGVFLVGVQADEGIAVVALFSLVAGGILYGASRVFRLAFPRNGQLQVEVCGDHIEFRRSQEAVATLRRQDIELIVIDEDRLAGVGSFTVHGPSESLLGMWETNWFVKPAPMVMRVLKRHGYPYAVGNALHGQRLFYRHRGHNPENSV